MTPVYDVRPVATILAECRDMRRQAKEFPSCSEAARRRIRYNRRVLAAIRSNLAEMRRAP